MQDTEINFKRRPVGSSLISEAGIRDEFVKTTEGVVIDRLSRHSYIHYIFEHLAQVASRNSHWHSPISKGRPPGLRHFPTMDHQLRSDTFSPTTESYAHGHYMATTVIDQVID
jgi:hypothetical protein